MADTAILQRYVEIEGRLRRIMTIVKNRGSEHSKDLRLYEITPEGLVVDGAVPAYRGLLTGHPDPKFIAPPERGRASRPRRSDQE